MEPLATNWREYWPIAQSHCKLNSNGSYSIHANDVAPYIEDELIDHLSPTQVPIICVSVALTGLLWVEPVELVLEKPPSGVDMTNEFEVLPHIPIDEWREAAARAIERRGEQITTSDLHDTLMPRLSYHCGKDSLNTNVLDHSVLLSKVMEGNSKGMFQPELGSMRELLHIVGYVIMTGIPIRNTVGSTLRRSDTAVSADTLPEPPQELRVKHLYRLSTSNEYWEITSVRTLCVRWVGLLALLSIAVVCGVYTDGNLLDKLLRPLELLSYVGLLSLVGARIEPENLTRFRRAMFGARKLEEISATDIGATELELVAMVGQSNIATPRRASFAGAPESKSALHATVSLGDVYRAGYTVHSGSISRGDKVVWLYERSGREASPLRYTPDNARTPHSTNRLDFVYHVPSSEQTVE